MFFTGRMPFLLPNQHCHNTERIKARKVITESKTDEHGKCKKADIIKVISKTSIRVVFYQSLSLSLFYGFAPEINAFIDGLIE